MGMLLEGGKVRSQGFACFVLPSFLPQNLHERGKNIGTLCLEGTRDSTSPMILTRWLSVDVSSRGGEWKWSHRGKWGWVADKEQPRAKCVLVRLPVGLLRGNRRIEQSEAQVSLEPYLSGYLLRLV